MRVRVASALDGILCVYKPADLSLTGLKKSIVKRIVGPANAAVGWPRLPTIEMPVVEEHPKSGALIVVGKKKQLDYSQHPLVVGEAFRTEDVKLEELAPMETASSGVCVFGVNGGCDGLDSIRSANWVNKWRIEAILGRETYKHEIKGKVTRRESFDHVNKQRLMKLLARMRADYRRMAFQMAEVDLQSVEAYSLATKGLPRPKLPGAQVVVDVKLLLFKLPYFAFLIDTIGENDAYLRCLVNEMGISVDTTASPARLIRRCNGPFRTEHSLLERQLSLQNIVDNIALCARVMKDNVYDPDVVNESAKDTSDEAFQERKKILDGWVQHELAPEDFDAMRPAWPREYL